jgi:hypothetical protein
VHGVEISIDPISEEEAGFWNGFDDVWELWPSSFRNNVPSITVKFGFSERKCEV